MARPSLSLFSETDVHESRRKKKVLSLIPQLSPCMAMPARWPTGFGSALKDRAWTWSQMAFESYRFLLRYSMVTTLFLLNSARLGMVEGRQGEKKRNEGDEPYVSFYMDCDLWRATFLILDVLFFSMQILVTSSTANWSSSSAWYGLLFCTIPSRCPCGMVTTAAVTERDLRPNNGTPSRRLITILTGLFFINMLFQSTDDLFHLSIFFSLRLSRNCGDNGIMINNL